jgi:hypothetical protein
MSEEMLLNRVRWKIQNMDKSRSTVYGHRKWGRLGSLTWSLVGGRPWVLFSKQRSYLPYYYVPTIR